MWVRLDPHLSGYEIMPIKLVAIRRGKRLPNRATIITALTKDIQNATAEGNRALAEYPTKPPGSTYRRTNTLKRSWSMAPVTISGNNLQGAVRSNSNIAPYNRDVQGKLQEPLFFTLGWLDVVTEAKRMQSDLIKRTRQTMKSLLR